MRPAITPFARDLRRSSAKQRHRWPSAARPGGSGSAVVRFTTQIAARFGVTVSDKVMAQAVPVIGAAAGSTINVIFTDYFQSVAQGHFTVRRLERRYGAQVVRLEYDRMLQELRAATAGAKKSGPPVKSSSY